MAPPPLTPTLSPPCGARGESAHPADVEGEEYPSGGRRRDGVPVRQVSPNGYGEEPCLTSQDRSKNQLRSQGPGWGPDGSAGGAGAAFAPGYSE